MVAGPRQRLSTKVAADGGAVGLGPGASWLGMGVVHQRVGRWPALPDHARAAVLVVSIVGVTAAVAGIALGLALGSPWAAAALGLAGGLGALPAAVVVWGLDLTGLRIGTGNAAMAKVTAPATLAAALCAGTVMGLLLARFTAAMANSSRQNATPAPSILWQRLYGSYAATARSRPSPFCTDSC
jgi:hypothetical protein